MGGWVQHPVRSTRPFDIRLIERRDVGEIRGGTLTIRGTLVSANSAAYGGALYAAGGATSIESGSVIDGNTSTYGGGAYVSSASLACSDADGLGTAMTTNTGGAIYFSSTGTNSVTVSNCDLGPSASATDNKSASGSPTCDVYTPTMGWYDYDDDVTFTCDGLTCI